MRWRLASAIFWKHVLYTLRPALNRLQKFCQTLLSELLANLAMRAYVPLQHLTM